MVRTLPGTRTLLVRMTEESLRPQTGGALDQEGPSDGAITRWLDPGRKEDALAWDRDVSRHPGGSVFHGSAWARVLMQTYGHRPFYLRIESGNGEVLALVPLMEVSSRLTGRRGVCLPFSDTCEPLCFCSSVESLVLESIGRMAREREWKHVEIRGAFETAPENASSGSSAEPSEAFYEHELDLQDEDAPLQSRLSESVRRAIRKAQRSGIETRVSNRKEDLLEYFRLHVRTRRRHGLPPQPRSFFENIGEQLMSGDPRDSGFVVLATRQGQPVAGAVFLRFGETSLYKFGASDKAHWSLRPNNLVMWEAIQFLQETRARVLSFGRTSIDDEGLRRFKLGWGGRESLIPYFRFDSEMNTMSPSSGLSQGIYRSIFAYLPLTINRLAGSLIYPHLD